MSSRMESIELESSRDKHAPPRYGEYELPPPYRAEPPNGISKSSLLLGLKFVIPGLIIVSAVGLGFKSSVATNNPSDPRTGRWPTNDGDVTMSQWPSTLFPNQDELPLAVAALALATAVFASVLLLFVIRNGPLVLSFSKRLALLIHLGLTAALALAATIYIFVLKNRSTGFDLAYAIAVASETPGTFTYDQGRFSKEAWACTVKVLPKFDKDLGGAMTKTCALEIGSRFSTLFTFFLSIGLFSLLYLDSRGGRHFMRP